MHFRNRGIAVRDCITILTSVFGEHLYRVWEKIWNSFSVRSTDLLKNRKRFLIRISGNTEKVN